MVWVVSGRRNVFGSPLTAFCMIAHAKRLLIPSLVPRLFLVERGNEPGDEAS